MSKEEIYKFYNGKDNILNVSLRSEERRVGKECRL